MNEIQYDLEEEDNNEILKNSKGFCDFSVRYNIEIFSVFLNYFNIEIINIFIICFSLLSFFLYSLFLLFDKENFPFRNQFRIFIGYIYFYIYIIESYKKSH